MASHIDEFIPFLPPPGDEDRLMTQEEYFSYCTTMRDTGVWGGEPEILALSKAYHVSIHVIQSSKPSIVVHEPEDMPPPIQNGRVVRISYHRRMYGLGEVRSILLLREINVESQMLALQLSTSEHELSRCTASNHALTYDTFLSLGIRVILVNIGGVPATAIVHVSYMYSKLSRQLEQQVINVTISARPHGTRFVSNIAAKGSTQISVRVVRFCLRGRMVIAVVPSFIVLSRRAC